MKRDDDVNSRRKRSKRRKKKTMAARADLHELYERSVQDPDVDAQTLATLYGFYRDEEPVTLREDFCGTATLAKHWVLAGSSRRAVGVDLDHKTLQWARAHNLETLKKGQRKRLELIEGNVLAGQGPKADVTCALNFSYCIFKQRQQLLEYFRVVREGLAPGGIFVLDVLGGTEAMGPDENVHDHDDFVYVWEQVRFDPLTHDFLAHIHFEFPDGSRVKKAYTYDWRLWSMPELCDLLDEAGFSATHRLWEKTDKRGEGLGLFYEPKPKRTENQESWWTYLVAER